MAFVSPSRPRFMSRSARCKDFFLGFGPSRPPLSFLVLAVGICDGYWSQRAPFDGNHHHRCHIQRRRRPRRRFQDEHRSKPTRGENYWNLCLPQLFLSDLVGFLIGFLLFLSLSWRVWILPTGMYVANRASDKITQLTDNVYICRSGSVILAFTFLRANRMHQDRILLVIDLVSFLDCGKSIWHDWCWNRFSWHCFTA